MATTSRHKVGGLGRSRAAGKRAKPGAELRTLESAARRQKAGRSRSSLGSKPGAELLTLESAARNQKAASTATTGGVPISGPTPAGRKPPPPFLTPGQQLALDNWHRSFTASMQGLDLADANALTNLNQRTQALGHQAAINTDMTNQVAGARGVFQSSIRDSALNDITATLAQNENILHTNYQTALTADQTRRTSVVGQNLEETGYYNGLAAQNAAAIDNPPPGTAGTAPAAAPKPAPQPKPQAPPKPTKVTTQPQSTGRGPGRPPRVRGPVGGLRPPPGPRVGGLAGGRAFISGAVKPPSGFGRAATIRLRGPNG